MIIFDHAMNLKWNVEWKTDKVTHFIQSGIWTQSIWLQGSCANYATMSWNSSAFSRHFFQKTTFPDSLTDAHTYTSITPNYTHAHTWRLAKHKITHARAAHFINTQLPTHINHSAATRGDGLRSIVFFAFITTTTTTKPHISWLQAQRISFVGYIYIKQIQWYFYLRN